MSYNHRTAEATVRLELAKLRQARLTRPELAAHLDRVEAVMHQRGYTLLQAMRAVNDEYRRG